MIWVELKKDTDGKLINVPNDGEYIVKTKTKASWNVLKVQFHTDKKGHHHWTCKNQEVTHYLYEYANREREKVST